MRINALDVILNLAQFPLRMTTGDEVFLGGQVLEHAASLEHLRDAELRHIEGAHTIDTLAGQGDGALGDAAAFGAQHAGNRLERRRLAGTVAAEQGGDGAGFDLQRDPAQHQDDLVVDDLDIVDRQHGPLAPHAAAMPLDCPNSVPGIRGPRTPGTAEPAASWWLRDAS